VSSLGLTISATGSTAVALTLLALAIRHHRRVRLASGVEAEADGSAKSKGASRPGLARLGAVLRPGDADAVAQLQGRLAQAGITSRDAIDLYLTIRVSAIVAGLLLSVLGTQLMSGPVSSVGWFVVVMSLAVIGPSLWLDIKTRQRQLDIGRSLPSTLDLLVTCLDAGLNLEQAMGRISKKRDNSPDEILAMELRTTLAEMRAGLSIDVAFKRLSARVGHPEVQNLSALIAQATALGANLGEALREHARTMRHHRIVFLEELAGKANAKLTLPLTICLLPSVMILLMGPAVLMILKSL
jgi:tight adherence protein C